MKKHAAKDFSDFRRMSPEAIVILFSHYVRTLFRNLFGVFVMTFFYRKKGLYLLLYTVLGILGIAIIQTLGKYLFTRFCIEGNLLYIRGGWLGRHNDTIPLDKVYALRTKRGFFYQMVNMVSVSFDTPATQSAEAELILTENDLELLIETIYRQTGHRIAVKTQTPQTTQESQSGLQPQTAEQAKTVQYNPWQLIMGAVTQNHLKGVGLVAALLFSILQDLDNVFFDFTKHLYQLDETMTIIEYSWMGVLIAFVGFYLGTLIIWVIYVTVKEYGLTLSISPDTLGYEAGMLTHKSVSIRKNKIVGITLKENPVEKQLGLCTLRIEQAKQADGSQDDKTFKKFVLYGWRHRNLILNWWQQGLLLSNIRPLRSGIGLFWFEVMMQMCIMIPISVITILALSLWSSIILIVLALAYGITAGILRMQHSGIALSGKQLIVYSGIWAKKYTLLPINKVEGVLLCQSFIQRKTQRATLIFHSMGQSCQVRSLPHADAARLRDLVLYHIESKRPRSVCQQIT